MDAASLSKYDAGIAKARARDAKGLRRAMWSRRRGADEPNPNRGRRESREARVLDLHDLTAVLMAGA